MSFNVELPDKITAQEAKRYLDDPNFLVQEKRNGHHRLVTRDTLVVTGDKLEMFNREGTQRNISSPLQSALLHPKLPSRYIVDVEQEKNDIYILDLLMIQAVWGTEWLAQQPYHLRLRFMKEYFTGMHPRVHVIESYYGANKAKAVKHFWDEKAEGVVFKDQNALYREGRSGQHHALKFWKTLDAVVIEMNPEGRDAVELGLFQDGKIRRICGSSLIGKGRIELGCVVEIKFLYATRDYHVVQPTILRRRDDKQPQECGVDQLVFNRDMMP